MWVRMLGKWRFKIHNIISAVNIIIDTCFQEEIRHWQRLPFASIFFWGDIFPEWLLLNYENEVVVSRCELSHATYCASSLCVPRAFHVWVWVPIAGLHPPPLTGPWQVPTRRSPNFREHHPALAATWHIRASTWPSPSKNQCLQTLMFEKASWLSFAPFPPNLKIRQWNIKIKPQRRISTGYHWGNLTGVSRWSRPALKTAQQVTRAPLFCSGGHPSTHGVSLLGFCLSHNTFFCP